jgi:hypothetical protein
MQGSQSQSTSACYFSDLRGPAISESPVFGGRLAPRRGAPRRGAARRMMTSRASLQLHDVVYDTINRRLTPRLLALPPEQLTPGPGMTWHVATESSAQPSPVPDRTGGLIVR